MTEALAIAGKAGISILEMSRSQMDKMTGGIVHQGIALQVPPYAYEHPDDLLARALEAPTPLIVALDGVTDPRNLGAVVRSAAAFGAQGVLIPERRSAGMTAAAWRTSAGAAARLPIARCTNLARTLTAYKAAGLFVVGLAAERHGVAGRSRGGHQPARGGGRLRGRRPGTAGRGELRPDRQHPDVRR